MTKEKLELIGYEFELEEEQRIVIEAQNYPVTKWQNHVVDTYDQSGRCRIRVKNGKPRLSIKVPLLSRDTQRSKCCIRLEFKPNNEEQEKDLLKIRELILKEKGTQTAEKWGAPIILTNKEKVWINKDAKGNFWIETDEIEQIEKLLPDGIAYLQHSMSNIKIQKNAANDKKPDWQVSKQIIRKNLEATSRTAKGKIDTSVDPKKERSTLTKKDIQQEFQLGLELLINYLEKNKDQEIKNTEDLKSIIHDILTILNENIFSDPTKYRTWEVPYGRKISPENIATEMENFYRNLYTKIREVEDGELIPGALGRWIELELDKNIHPFADGCGKLAKAISFFFLTRFNSPLPLHESRDEYYQAINESEETFKKYYREALERSLKKFYS